MKRTLTSFITWNILLKQDTGRLMYTVVTLESPIHILSETVFARSFVALNLFCCKSSTDWMYASLVFVQGKVRVFFILLLMSVHCIRQRLSLNSVRQFLMSCRLDTGFVLSCLLQIHNWYYNWQCYQWLVWELVKPHVIQYDCCKRSIVPFLQNGFRLSIWFKYWRYETFTGVIL